MIGMAAAGRAVFATGMLVMCAPGALAAGPSGASGAAHEAAPSTTARDGSHDFDFEIGIWASHSIRRVHPLTHSNVWTAYDGTAIVRKIWKGKANLVDLQADGPAGRVEGLSLRLYDPQAHQWALYYANSKGDTVSVPSVGRFRHGRGVFFDKETYQGRPILVRQIWSDISAKSCHFEQAFSADGGKTWETNLITTDTRLQDERHGSR